MIITFLYYSAFLEFRITKRKTLIPSESACLSVKTIYLEIACWSLHWSSLRSLGTQKKILLLNNAIKRYERLCVFAEFCMTLQNLQGRYFPWTYSYEIWHEVRTYNTNKKIRSVFFFHYISEKKLCHTYLQLFSYKVSTYVKLDSPHNQNVQSIFRRFTIITPTQLEPIIVTRKIPKNENL